MESARSTIPGDRNVAQTVLKRRSGYGLRDFSTTRCVKRTSLPPPPKGRVPRCLRSMHGLLWESRSNRQTLWQVSARTETAGNTEATTDRAQDRPRRLSNFARIIESLEPMDWIFPRGGRGVSFVDRGDRFNVVSWYKWMRRRAEKVSSH